MIPLCPRGWLVALLLSVGLHLGLGVAFWPREAPDAAEPGVTAAGIGGMDVALAPVGGAPGHTVADIPPGEAAAVQAGAAADTPAPPAPVEPPPVAVPPVTEALQARPVEPAPPDAVGVDPQRIAPVSAPTQPADLRVPGLSAIPAMEVRPVAATTGAPGVGGAESRTGPPAPPVPPVADVQPQPAGSIAATQAKARAATPVVANEWPVKPVQTAAFAQAPTPPRPRPRPPRPRPPRPQPPPVAAVAPPTARASAASTTSTPRLQSAPRPASSPPAASAAGRAGPPQNPNPGHSDAASGGWHGAKAHYGAALLAWLEQYKKYPGRARRRQQQGVVRLYVVIDRHGQVLEARIEETSGHRILDRATIEMLERAKPLPPMPDDIRQAPVEFIFPIRFQIG